MRISELKLRAKERLKDNYGKYLLITFLATLIIGAVGSTWPVGILVSGPISVGLAFVFMSLTRKMDSKIEDLFYGFKSFLNSFVLGLLTSLFIFLWLLLFIVPGIIKAFAYSMAPYIMADNPEMTGLETLTASKEMMYGHKGRLFGLYLSFFGWFLLCIITCGIGFIFLAPWVRASVAQFYQNLLDEQSASK